MEIQTNVTDTLGSNVIIIQDTFQVEINWMIDSTEYFNSEYITVNNVEQITIGSSTFKKLTLNTSNNTLIPGETELRFINITPDSYIINEISNNIQEEMN